MSYTVENLRKATYNQLAGYIKDAWDLIDFKMPGELRQLVGFLEVYDYNANSANLLMQKTLQKLHDLLKVEDNSINQLLLKNEFRKRITDLEIEQSDSSSRNGKKDKIIFKLSE